MPPFKTVFVTGGAGYIGSHTVLELVEAGYEVSHIMFNFIFRVHCQKIKAPLVVIRVAIVITYS